MDDFSQTPSAPDASNGSLEDVRQAIATLEQEHKSKGIELSGRIIHVCHYLPIVSTLVGGSHPAILSPPKTPDHGGSSLKSLPTLSGTAESTTKPSNSPRWTLSTRRGHTAMISGIRSLSDTHQHILVAWTGDIEVGSAHDTIPTNSLSSEDKNALETAIATYKDDFNKGAITYVPVWLDDAVAHGHYEGYCKTSQSSPLSFSSGKSNFSCSVMAAIPLSFMARRRHRVAT